MGDAYRGLTIRIGADVTSINGALKSVKSAASQTQSELSKIKRALKLDPGNLTLADKQLGAVGKTADTLYAQLNRMKDVYKELGSQRLSSGGTVAQLASSTDDAIASVQRLHERYNAITDELARTYNQIEKISGIKLDDDHIFSDENIENARKLGVAIDETVDDAVSVAQKLQGAGFDIPDSTIQHIATLRENINETADAMQDMDKAASFQKMGTDLATLESRAQSTARALVELNRSSEIGKSSNVRSITEQIESIDRASEDVAKRLEQVNHALELDPGNVVAAEQQMVLLAEQANLAQQKADLLRQKLQSYSDAGIDKVADGVENVSQNLEDSREAAVKAAQAYEQAENRLADLRQQADNLSSSSGADKEGQKYKELQSAINAAEQEVEQYRAAAQQASAAYESAKAVSEFRETEQAAAEAESEVSSLRQRMSELSGVNWSNVSNSLKDVGQTLTNTVTDKLVNLGQSAIETSTTFDSAFRDMKKTVNGSDEDFQRLRQSAIDFSTTHVTSADQILEMEAMGGQLGIAVDQLEDFAETASNLDIATDIDADEISQSMGQLVNIMSDLNVTADDAHGGLDNFADSLVRLGNNNAALESQIMDITMRIASQGNIIGMTTPQILAWSTALASTGQNSEAAGTALSKTMSMIESAVAGGTSAVADYAEQAGMSVQDFLDKCKNSPSSLDTFAQSIGTTGKKLANEVLSGKGSLQDFADVARMSADDFAEAWESRPSEALKAFIEGLKQSQDEGKSMDSILEGLGITSVRQKQAIEGLTQTTDTLNSSLQMSQDAWDGVSDSWGDAGDAAREAEQKSEGFSGAIGKLKNNWDALKIAIGDGMTPFVEALSGGMQQLTSALGGVSSPMKTFVVGIGGVAAAAGPALVAIGSVIGAVSKIKGAFGGIKSAIGDAGAALSLMLESGTGLLGSFGLFPAVIGVAAVGAIASYIATTSEAKRKQDEFNGALSEMRSSADGVDSALAAGADAVKDYQAASSDASLSTEELTQKIQDHNQAMDDIKSSAEGSVDILGQYKTVLDECAGAGEVSADRYAQLEWALDGLNNALGTNFSAQDVLTGKYQDEQGEIQNTIDAIDQLIQKRQEAAAVSAAQDLYTESIKNQMELEKNAADARRNYYDALDDYDERVQELVDGGKSEAEARALVSDEMQRQGRGIADLKDKYNDAAEAASAAKEESSEWAQYLSAVTSASTEAGQSVLSFMQATAGWSEMASQTGYSMEALAGACAQAGVSTEQLAAMGSDGFEALVDSCNGDLSLVIQKLEAYNATEIDPKSADISINDLGLTTAEGHAVEWNNGKLEDKDANVVINPGDIVYFLGKAYEWNGTTLKPLEGEIDVKGSGVDGTAEEKLDTLNQHIPTQASFTIDADGSAVNGTAQAGLEGTTGAASGLQAYAGHAIYIEADGSAVDLTAKYGLDQTNSAVAQMAGKTVTASVDGSATDGTAAGNIDTTSGSVDQLTGKDVLVDITGNIMTGAVLLAIANIVSQLGAVTDRDFSVNLTGNAVDGSAVGSLQAASTAVQGLVSRNVQANISGNATSGAAVGSLQAAAGAITSLPSRNVQANVSGNAVTDTAANKVRQAASAINAMRGKSVRAQVTGNAQDGSAKSNVDQTRSSINAMASRSVSAKVSGNAVNGSAASAIWNTVRAINALSGKSVTTTVRHVTINETRTVKDAKGGILKNARGGIAQAAPRYLATGAVYTRPTYIDARNLIGEAGAEYYDGRNIVPLQGRYGQEFAGTIAEELSRRIVGGENVTYNLNVDGATINGDEHTRDLFVELLFDLKRRADQYV